MQRIDYSRTTTATVPDTATVNTGSTYYECVDLATAVNYLKQNYGSVTIEDSLIKTLIVAARHWIEEHTKRAIVRQTVVLYVHDDEQQVLEISLPFYPVVLTSSDVTSVKRVDYEGTETTLARNTDYYIEGLNALRVTLSKTWSTGAIGGAGSQGIKITYEAGYATIADIPKPMVLAILKLMAESYINRESSVDWGINTVPFDVIKLLAPYTDLYL
ncbi:MAG: hypothetical protein WC359_13425 [Dehalococcoidia bacterium]|jgi:uncharacterized phiE125 gp8 family phage protein